MKQFSTSLILGILTILVWFFASIKFNEPEEVLTKKTIVENIKNPYQKH